MSVTIGMIIENAMVSEDSIELNVVPSSTTICLMNILFCEDWYVCYLKKRRTKRETKTH